MPLSPDRKAVSWSAEEAAYQRENSIDGEKLILASSGELFRDRFNRCHALAQQRFNCPNISFFECNGLRVNEDGLATSIIPIGELTLCEIANPPNNKLPHGNELTSSQSFYIIQKNDIQ